MTHVPWCLENEEATVKYVLDVGTVTSIIDAAPTKKKHSLLP